MSNTEQQQEVTLDQLERAKKAGFITHLTASGVGPEETKVKYASYNNYIAKYKDRYNSIKAAVLEGFKS